MCATFLLWIAISLFENLIYIYIAGVEKNNDDCRRIHLQKSNKWDASKDILLVEKRLEMLSDLERTPREYKKTSNDYWYTGIKEVRAKRQRLCCQEQGNTSSNEVCSIQDLAPEVIKARLKDMGILTRVRNPKRLQEIYEDALQANSTSDS